jgi:methionyl-tRNA formyltransferase
MAQPLRLVFMGTPEFSTHALQALVDAGHTVICAYSQPPRPAGRGYEVQKSPVHLLAETLGIEVRIPKSLKSPDEQKRFAELGADAAVVVAYGLLLPKAILEAPRFGCFNIHASLLPRWRGAAPIQRAIMAGDAQSGVCIMRMDEGLDTGPVMDVEALPITPEMTAANLHDALAKLGARMIVRTLEDPAWQGAAQSTEGITYARKIEKAEAHVDFARSAPEVRNHIHGLSPFPGAWCLINEARVKLLNAELVAGSGPAGQALDDGLTFACGTGAIRILRLQREGKGPMDAATFLRGFPVPTGTMAK